MSRSPWSTVMVWAFLLLFLCATPVAAAFGADAPDVSPQAAAQHDTVPSSMAETDEAGLPEAPEAWVEDEYVEAPRRVVAMLIRAALQSPENQESWAELADALPELGETEDGESFGRLLRAAQIADSVALAAELSSAGGGTPEGSVLEKAGLAVLLPRVTRGLKDAVAKVVVWVSRNDLPLVLTLSALLIALILMKGREPWMARFRSGGRGAEPAGEHLLKEGTSRGLDTARALWSSGLPVHEIARRTGLAQDALTVMLSLQGSPRA